MQAELVALGLVQLLPLARTVNRAELLGLLHDVRGVDGYAPVDALGGVPLLVLAALVEIEQAGTPVVVFPVEPGRAGGRYIPGAALDGADVVVVRTHGGPSGNCVLRYYLPVRCC